MTAQKERSISSGGSPGPSRADALLIERFRRGDAAAFEKIFHRYVGQIHRFSSRMCRHAEDAQDVLQETFLSAFRNLRDFRGKASLTTWLYKIASSACIKKRRKGKYSPKQEISLEEFIPAAGSEVRDLTMIDWSHRPLRDLQRKELQRILDRAITDLPEKERLVLVLRDMEGISARETGRALGISVAAVKSRLHRARLFLRERLNAYYEKNV